MNAIKDSKYMSITDMASKDKEQLLKDYMTNSFYVPLSYLRDGRWLVEPIRRISVAQFKQLVEAAKVAPDDSDVFLVFEGATYNILVSEQQVGISERTERSTGKKYLICKTWQGAAK